MTQPSSHLRTSWWWTVLAVLIFLVVGVSAVVLQKQLRESQENRGQAAGVNGIVEIGRTDSMVLSKNPSFLQFGVNTHDAVIRDITLNFDVLIPAPATTAAQLSSEAIVTVQNAGVYHADSNIALIPQTSMGTQIGWRVTVLLTAVDQENGFTTGQLMQPLFRFDFKLPETDGTLEVKFDQGSSTAYLWQQNTATDTDILKTLPTVSLNIDNDDCVYTYSDWGSCNSTTQGQQTRTFTTYGSQCSSPHSMMLSQACFGTVEQCHYAYSDWGACNNGWQTRTYSSVNAAGSSHCAWYLAETLQPLTQACQMPVVDAAPTVGLSTYTYETCWNDRSEGGSTYLIWDKDLFPNVTKIDVSTTSDFKSYANKDVTGATSVMNEAFLATDGTNFRTYTDGKRDQWVFWPGYTYYFRFFYGVNQHSGVITYFVPQCAGTGGVNYKQCNESCTANKDCASNLSCVSGVCRRADNQDSTICAVPPDRGLKRTCNEYCSDSSECGSGLTCWWNRCRAPKNLDDVSCRTTPSRSTNVGGYSTKGGVVYAGYSGAAAADTTPESSCNESCRSNRDCAANLRCFQGSCRLADNVTNTSCLSVKAAAAATLSATTVTSPTEAPQEVVTQPEAEKVSAFTALAQWLAGRLGFLVIGLILAVVILMIWPLLRPTAKTPTRLSSETATYRSYPPVHAGNSNSRPSGTTGPTASPNAPLPPSSMVQKPINQVMNPPRSEP